MGFLSNLTGVPDMRIVQLGHPGRGLILDVTQTGTMLEAPDGTEETICIFILEVRRPGERPYHATARQRFPWHRMDQLEIGSTLVAVRIDPRNESHVAIDWKAPLVLAA